MIKSDKGNWAGVINDYYKSFNKLFPDSTKLKRFDADPTNNATFESYIIKTKIREDVCQEIQPKNAKVARAQGLPKAQKSFERVLSFRPVINTVGSTHGNLDKYIKKLLSPLT